MHHTYTEAEMLRRMDRVRVLVDTHDDIYDDVSRNESDAAGFAEPVFRTGVCGSCSGVGCGACERVAARALAEHGVHLQQGRVFFLDTDPYDTGRDGTFDPSSRTRREEARRIDNLIDRLRGDELVRAGEIAHVDWERFVEMGNSRDARGSYRELRVALDTMPRTLTADRAVRWLAEHLPRTIRVPRWAFERELERLGEQVVSLKQDGLDTQQIAQALSVSRRQVRRLLREARSK